jgi:hypothetical protein
MGVNSEYDGILPRKSVQLVSCTSLACDGIPYLSALPRPSSGSERAHERLVLICERPVLDNLSRLSTLRALRIHLGTGYSLQMIHTGRVSSGINSNQRLLVAMSNRCSGFGQMR